MSCRLQHNFACNRNYRRSRQVIIRHLGLAAIDMALKIFHVITPSSLAPAVPVCLIVGLKILFLEKDAPSRALRYREIRRALAGAI